MLWRFKILAKLLLSHLPLGYTVWRKLGLFRLGSMDQEEYPQKIFQLHMNRAYPDGIPEGLSCLELGPGDSVATAVIANALGIERIYLVDTGNYATVDLDVYKSIADWLRNQGLSTVDFRKINTFDELLQSCNAVYLTDGYHSLKSIQKQSIDFIWSHSVLEHVRKSEFVETIYEMRRVIKADGFMSHNVDFMDHFGGALNNLRFSNTVWENDFFANSGFYTNRIRYHEMTSIIEQAGFIVNETNYSQWRPLPTKKEQMAYPYNQMTEDELNIKCCHYLLSPKSN